MVFVAYLLENAICFPGVGHLQPIFKPHSGVFCVNVRPHRGAFAAFPKPGVGAGGGGGEGGIGTLGID